MKIYLTLALFFAYLFPVKGQGIQVFITQWLNTQECHHVEVARHVYLTKKQKWEKCYFMDLYTRDTVLDDMYSRTNLEQYPKIKHYRVVTYLPGDTLREMRRDTLIVRRFPRSRHEVHYGEDGNVDVLVEHNRDWMPYIDTFWYSYTNEGYFDTIRAIRHLEKSSIYGKIQVAKYSIKVFTYDKGKLSSIYSNNPADIANNTGQEYKWAFFYDNEILSNCIGWSRFNGGDWEKSLKLVFIIDQFDKGD